MDTVITVLLWIAGLIMALAMAAGLGYLIHQNFADGPSGPLAGATFKSGEPTPFPSNSAEVLAGDFEFELTGEGTSRTAGGIALDDALYLSCDLGFVWARFPAGMPRTMLSVIWFFKDWHEKAQNDGRIRIRKDGKVYEAAIELEQDPATLAALKSRIEVLASEFMGELSPRTEKKPNDILFFKILPRSSAE